MARTFQGNTKKPSLDELQTHSEVCGSVEFWHSSWDLVHMCSHMGHAVMDLAWFVVLHLPNRISSYLYLSINGTWFEFTRSSSPPLSLPSPRPPPPAPQFWLPSRWNFANFKTATRCRADPRSMFCLQCILSKRCLLFLPLLILLIRVWRSQGIWGPVRTKANKIP